MDRHIDKKVVIWVWNERPRAPKSTFSKIDPNNYRMPTRSSKDYVRSNLCQKSKLTTIHCDKTVSEKFPKYQEELKAHQKIFFKEKADKLAFICAQEIACGKTPTVTEEEIAEAQEQAKQYQ